MSAGVYFIYLVARVLLDCVFLIIPCTTFVNFQIALNSIHVKVTNTQLDKLIGRFDEDESGHVDIAEFLHALKSDEVVENHAEGNLVFGGNNMHDDYENRSTGSRASTGEQ